jgi:hypothetical protein
MSRKGDVTARVRLVLAVVVGAAVALLMPWLTATATDAPMLAILTSLTLAVVTGLIARAALQALSAHAPARPPGRADGAVLLAGRVTDSPHHPLRPRAPGLV